MKKILCTILMAGLVASSAYAADTSYPQPVAPPQQAATAAAPATAQAAPVATAAPTECTMVSISASFIIEAPTYAKVKFDLDDKLYKLDLFVRDNHIPRFEVQSLNYTIRSDQVKNTPVVYRMTGSAEYKISSSDDAFKIGQFLTRQKFQVTVSNKNPKATVCNTTTVSPVNAPSADVKNMLKAAPPGEEQEPTRSLYNNNGATPDLPVLDQDPPEAQPLKEKR
jgi:hypothetical protein